MHVCMYTYVHIVLQDVDCKYYTIHTFKIHVYTFIHTCTITYIRTRMHTHIHALVRRRLRSGHVNTARICKSMYAHIAIQYTALCVS